MALGTTSTRSDWLWSMCDQSEISAPSLLRVRQDEPRDELDPGAKVTDTRTQVSWYRQDLDISHLQR